MRKKGQVTIFIIIAILIVAVGLIIFFVFPKIKTTQADTTNPVAFIEACIKDDIEDAIEKVSLQGGSIEPENYYLYQDDKIEYLCYTNEFYLPCLVQRPMLKQHIENEIENEILEETQKCFQSLKSSYEDQGYGVRSYPTGPGSSRHETCSPGVGRPNRARPGSRCPVGQLWRLLRRTFCRSGSHCRQKHRLPG